MERLPIALSLPTRSGASGQELARIARQAEEADFAAVYVAERVADALAICQQILEATSRVSVGTAIANARLRHPVLAAMTAVTLEESSGGRFVLGLGTANDQLNHDRLGLGSVPAVDWMAEYVEIIRQVCTGKPVQFAGRFFHVDRLVLDRPRSARPPLYLAAMMPIMQRLAGRVADGVILTMQSPEGIAGIVRLLASVAGQRAADLDELVVSSVIPCCVSRDVERAREVAAEVVLDYVLHPSASSIFGAATEPGLIDAIQTQMQAGERARAAALVSDDLAERFVVFGTPAECAEKIHVYRRAGVQRPILFPRPVTDDWTGAIWEMAEAYTSLGQISTDASRPINNRNWSNEHD